MICNLSTLGSTKSISYFKSIEGTELSICLCVEHGLIRYRTHKSTLVMWFMERACEIWFRKYEKVRSLEGISSLFWKLKYNLGGAVAISIGSRSYRARTKRVIGTHRQGQ